MKSEEPTTDDPYIGSPDNPKTAAYLCYFTFIGWLIAYFALYRNKKTAYAGFHMRQSLLIHIISFILKVCYSFFSGTTAGFIIVCILAAGLFIIWLMGFIDSLNDRQKSLPVIDNMAQNLFAKL